MDANQIADVLDVSQILSDHGEYDAAHSPGLIADIIKWRDGSSAEPTEIVATVEDKPKGKRGKATESDDSDKFEATPDPSDEPDF